MIGSKYYVRVERIFELHSYNTELKKCTYSTVWYIVCKRKFWGKDKLIKSFKDVNEAVDYCNKLNKI